MSYKHATPARSEFQSTLLQTLRRLRQSPTFAMSLGAKELFHTNFLGFLLESREPGLSPLQDSLRVLFGIAQKPGEEAWCFAYRELSSLDLVIVPVKKTPSTDDESDEAADERSFEPSGSLAAVVEAKLKALPTAVQLQRYDEKLKNDVTIEWQGPEGKTARRRLGCSGKKKSIPIKRWLLTLDRSPPDCLGRDAAKWVSLPWSAVVNFVREFARTADRKVLAPRMCEVIADYADSLDDVLQVVQATDELYRKAVLRPYAEFLADIARFDELRAARLVDLVGKRSYSAWLSDLLMAIEATVPEAQRPGKLTGEVFYTNGLPGLTVEWDSATATGAKEVLRIGVQIQGKSYRHFVATKSKWAGLEGFVVSSGLLDKWMTGEVGGPLHGQPLMAQRPRNSAPVPPRSGRYDRQRQTNLRKYGADAFLYSDVDLALSGPSLEDIQKAVCGSMARAAALVRGLQS